MVNTFEGVELREIPFGAAVAPWAGVAGRTLKEKMPKVISERVMEDFESALIERLSELCCPAFVLEMHIVKMQQGLNGESSEARYDDYVNRFLGDSDYLKTFFEEYSVLQEWVEDAKELWTNNVAEFFSRLDRDYEELQRRFGLLGSLKEIKWGLSDPHNGNQSVYELLFESGVTLFYKPKSLGIDVVFNEFLSELNESGLAPDLKTFQVWDRMSYGWVEKVEHLPCTDEGEVGSYFIRSGMLLCLFYLFGGTDIHQENLIASGAYPVIIDLESLFHPNLSSQSALDEPREWKQSVLHVGMLPSFILGEKGLPGIDISGFGGGGGKSPSFARKWENINTDEMRLTYYQPTIKAQKNLACIGETVFEAKDYLDAIVSGFKTMYGLIQEQRTSLLEEGGWLDRFAQVPVRCICRHTRLYLKLLQQLLDPKCLRDKALHQETLDILDRYMLENGNEHLRPVVTEERRAMQQRDIPFFQTVPSSKDLYLDGKVIIRDVLEGATCDAARELIEGMNEEGCLEQINLIEQSFYALDYSKKGASGESVDKRGFLGDMTDEELVEEAIKVGQTLFEKGRRDRKGGLRWIGIEVLPAEEQAELAPLSQNLYGGTLGLSLFFAALFNVTKDSKWKEGVAASLQPFCELIEGEGNQRIPGAIGLGGMTGVGSFVYALECIAKLIDGSKYRKPALFLTTLVKDEHIEEDTQFDIISGGAGFVLALLSLKDASLLPLAQKMGDHLAGSAQREEVGVSWPFQGRQGLLGFSHGTAGIAFALEKLAVATGKDHYFKVADQAIAYEQSHFSKEAGNWPDFRKNEPSLSSCSWCHGAPGVGLARACSSRVAHQDVDFAVNSTKKSFKHHAHHLCCGDLGRAEILATIAKQRGDAALGRFAREQIAAVVQQARAQGHYALNDLLPPGVFSPGFMQGLSGIGYTLLRNTLVGKDLPNVLILE